MIMTHRELKGFFLPVQHGKMPNYLLHDFAIALGNGEKLGYNIDK